MQGSIELKTEMPSVGGMLKSLVSKENIFRPVYSGRGEIYFGPPIFGEYFILDLQNEAWVLDQGAYVCSDIGINLGVIRNSVFAGIAGGEGFFQTKVEGTGKVVGQAQGPVQEIVLQNDKLVVDGRFAVAREAKLNFSVQKVQKSLIGSMASGEGFVNVIEGSGKVLIAPIPNVYNSLSATVAGVIPRRWRAGCPPPGSLPGRNSLGLVHGLQQGGVGHVALLDFPQADQPDRKRPRGGQQRVRPS
jgi:uncharacterized protein (AIM24 family)